jgi:hypothetical protein
MGLFASAGLSGFVLGIGAGILVVRMLVFLVKNDKLSPRAMKFLGCKILLFNLIAAASFKMGMMLSEHRLTLPYIVLSVLVAGSLVPLWMLTTRVFKGLQSNAV